MIFNMFIVNFEFPFRFRLNATEVSASLWSYHVATRTWSILPFHTEHSKVTYRYNKCCGATTWPPGPGPSSPSIQNNRRLQYNQCSGATTWPPGSGPSSPSTQNNRRLQIQSVLWSYHVATRTWSILPFHTEHFKATNTIRVVELFLFGPAPAPASQDGCSGSRSSSSSVVHNLLLYEKSVEIFNFLSYQGWKGKIALICSSSTLRKGTY